MVCFTHTEAVANVPSRAAIAHSITVPLRPYGLHRSITKGRYRWRVPCETKSILYTTPVRCVMHQ